MLDLELKAMDIQKHDEISALIPNKGEDSKHGSPNKKSAPVSLFADVSIDSSQKEFSLDQATFFRAVNEDNVKSVQAILRNRDVDINAYNADGVTALFLAVYRYENSRDVNMVKTLLDNGAKATKKALSSSQKLSILKHDQKNPIGDSVSETKRVSLKGKVPLQIALELKSALYLKGWEYRHWDEMLKVLSSAVITEIEKEEISVNLKTILVPIAIQEGWKAVFVAGKHETVEVWAENHYLDVLKHLLVSASKYFKFNCEKATQLSTERIELKDASFSVVKVMMEFLYTGAVESTFMSSRGIDLLNAAHRYGVESLKKLCEEQISATPENWIKLLHSAMESNSKFLQLKCAKSIYDTIQQRLGSRLVLKHAFSDHLESLVPAAEVKLFDS